MVSIVPSIRAVHNASLSVLVRIGGFICTLLPNFSYAVSFKNRWCGQASAETSIFFCLASLIKSISSFVLQWSIYNLQLLLSIKNSLDLCLYFLIVFLLFLFFLKKFFHRLLKGCYLAYQGLYRHHQRWQLGRQFPKFLCVLPQVYENVHEDQ